MTSQLVGAQRPQPSISKSSINLLIKKFREVSSTHLCRAPKPDPKQVLRDPSHELPQEHTRPKAIRSGEETRLPSQLSMRHSNTYIARRIHNVAPLDRIRYHALELLGLGTFLHEHAILGPTFFLEGTHRASPAIHSALDLQSMRGDAEAPAQYLIRSVPEGVHAQGW
jgi:hypothetical protein